LPQDIQPAFGCDLLAAFGHQTDVLGRRSFDDGDHLVGHGRFEVQRHADGLLEADHVFIADVAAVFAQVEGDDVGTAFHGQLRGSHRVWEEAAARIAHRGHVVDVDAQQRRVHGGEVGAGEGHGWGSSIMSWRVRSVCEPR